MTERPANPGFATKHSWRTPLGTPGHILTLPGPPARDVCVGEDEVLEVRSGFGTNEYKRTYSAFVDAYRRSGLLHRLRDRFHSMQAHLHVPARSGWLDLLARLTTPVPQVVRYGKFLDVGCNTGSFLSKLPDPWERYGIEINPEAVRAARKLRNIRVFEGPLESFETALCFDFVRVSHAIEHVVDSDSFLRHLYNLTADDGYALLYTPNTRSISFRLFRQHWAPLHELTHVRLFNLDNLSTFSERVGFHVVERGTYYMGVTADSLLRALGIPPSSRAFRIGFSVLLIFLYPASFPVNLFCRGGALYLYLHKPATPHTAVAHTRDMDQAETSNREIPIDHSAGLPSTAH